MAGVNGESGRWWRCPQNGKTARPRFGSMGTHSADALVNDVDASMSGKLHRALQMLEVLTCKGRPSGEWAVGIGSEFRALHCGAVTRERWWVRREQWVVSGGRLSGGL